MANHKSEIKRIKQSLKKRDRNRTAMATLRTVIKKFNAAVATNVGEAASVLADTVPAISKAASRGIIHKNNASRKISRLSKKLHKAALSAKGV